MEAQQTKQAPVALITGASRGIGRAIAKAFALAGYQTVIHYHRRQDQALTLQAELEQAGVPADRLLLVQADVASAAEVEAMLAAVFARFGKVDVLVNNAGIAGQNLFTDLTEAEWDHIFAVNVKGVFLCSKGVLPGMISRKSGQIINIASIWGMVGASCEVDYSASKGAVIALTKALAKEVGPSGIRVNCIAPGVIATEMNAGLSQTDLAALQDATPLETIGTPEDIAALALFLASPGGRFITGQVISPNGGFVIT